MAAQPQSTALPAALEEKVTFPYAGFNSPTGVAISPDGAFALVVNYNRHHVARIDLAGGGEVTTSYTGFTYPLGVAISPDGALALVANCDRNN
jgi:DNA-binding beta-propeller fold protein YncE